jgi:hypothetical protein
MFSSARACVLNHVTQANEIAWIAWCGDLSFMKVFRL